VRLVTRSIVALAGLSAALLAQPGTSAVAAEVVNYHAPVRASGQLVISFHGDRAAGCEASFRCDVQAGTVRWTPRSRGQLDLSRTPGGRLRGYLYFYGTGETSVETIGVVQRVGPDGSHVCADARGSGFSSSLPVITVEAKTLRFGLRPRPGVFGPPTTALLATNCGGPLATDVLRSLPSGAVSLRALRSDRATIDLSGSAAFSSGGLAGTVTSTIALRVGQARVRRVRRPVRRPPERPNRPPLQSISVEYRVERVRGSLAVDIAGDPRTCTPLDACGVGGTLTATPRSARGEAYVFAYGRLPRLALRRAVGLAPGPLSRRSGVYGYLTFNRGRGAVTAVLDRDGTPACRDTTSVSGGVIDLRARGRRVTARLASGDYGIELLRTRCPGPLLADIERGTPLAVGRIPLRALGRRRLTLRLDRGARAVTPGYMLRSRPDIKIVLEREEVKETELSGGSLVEVDEGGGGGGGGGGGSLARAR
jgi:hypothetical protein